MNKFRYYSSSRLINPSFKHLPTDDSESSHPPRRVKEILSCDQRPKQKNEKETFLSDALQLKNDLQALGLTSASSVSRNLSSRHSTYFPRARESLVSLLRSGQLALCSAARSATIPFPAGGGEREERDGISEAALLAASPS